MNLSRLAEEASKGAEILVTKHNKPYIRLAPGVERGLYRGHLAGRQDLKPALEKATAGRWLRYLEEDRNEE